MGATVTPKQGYLAVLTYGGDNIHVLNDIDVGGLEMQLDNISALGDTIVPHQSFAPGTMDRGGVKIPCNVVYDAANDGVTEILAHKIAMTTDTLILLDALAGTTLLSGTAFVNYRFKTGIEGQQNLDVVFTYTGALTGSLVA